MRIESVSSRWWMLINSNIKESDTRPEAVRKRKDFVEALKRIFLSKNILNFIDIKDEDDRDMPKEKLISRIDSEVALEVGTKGGFLHAHVLITVHHRSTIRLDSNRIMQYVSLKYNFSIYVSPPQLKPDQSIFFVRYQEKTMKRAPRLIIQGRLTFPDGHTDAFFHQY
jgi:hypothetical protein